MAKRGVVGEREGKGESRRRTIHEEKLLEETLLTTRQQRNRIPTDVLAQLQRQSNISLRAALLISGLSPEVYSYIEWELEYRRAHGLVMVDTFDDRGAAPIQVVLDHSTSS